MAEKMVPEMATGKEGGGWKKRLFPGLFRPNTDGARYRSLGSLGALQELQTFSKHSTEHICPFRYYVYLFG